MGLFVGIITIRHSYCFQASATVKNLFKNRTGDIREIRFIIRSLKFRLISKKEYDVIHKQVSGVYELGLRFWPYSQLFVVQEFVRHSR